MKVRIRQKSEVWWVIEVKHWYWPFWNFAGYSATKESALKTADILKNPKIIEIK